MGGLLMIECGYCGVRLTLYDPHTGLASVDGWTTDGATWHPHPRRRQRHSRATTSRAMVAVSWLRGDHRMVALLPVSSQNGWMSPALPVRFECQRCVRPSQAATAGQPGAVKPAASGLDREHVTQPRTLASCPRASKPAIRCRSPVKVSRERKRVSLRPPLGCQDKGTPVRR